jgi:hypothetical protein
MRSAAVAKKLVALGYRELFLRDDAEVDALWRSSADELAALAGDAGQDAQARFLAAEILFARAAGFPPVEMRATLAPVYAAALAGTAGASETWRLRGNQWGLMYRGDSVGSVGKHLLALGADAVAALRPLLGDRGALLYDGSQEATLGNSLEYRIKDAAAYFIGRISGVPVVFHRAAAERDAEIAKRLH